MEERLGIAGSGEIACGLARVAAARGPVVLWARSDDSAERARETLAAEGAVRVETDLAALEEASFAVEAIVEDHDAKASLLARLDEVLEAEAVLATTTSSLAVESLASATGRPERFVGLHVFNPVPKMRLVEVAFPAGASDDTRERAHALCRALEKTAIEVPADLPGFVVNRLLFPFLFDAVRLAARTGMEAEQVDACMKLGAGHPMGPLALLDLVGLDVAAAIGEAIEVDVPDRLRALVEEGALGRKSGRGFYDYG
jgi:3-hydroxybutyryl-CoA dehydrogenase